LIDDEPLASAELSVLLREHSDIEVVGTAEDFREALNLIHKTEPDLLFLDINMPGKNGFELLEELDFSPNVIFVTAHDQYALNAYEVNALDYVLKPVNPARLSDALEKVRRLIGANHEEKHSTEISLSKRIFVKDGDKCFFVPISEIYLIESMGNYARLHYGQNKPLLHKSLNYLEDKLPSEHFFRANRQQIINLNYIRNIHPFFNSTLRIEMESGENVDISQRQTVKFRELTGI